MYLKHFGLTEFPFTITPDTGFALSTRAHQDALNTLLVALQCGEGFIKVVGEVGTGKTLLCRRLLQTLGDKAVTAYLPNPQLEPQTLLMALAEELRLDGAASLDQFHLLKKINLGLLDCARRSVRVVLCIDEAQAMPLETLEALRLVSNMETEKRKLLQIVLFVGRGARAAHRFARHAAPDQHPRPQIPDVRLRRGPAACAPAACARRRQGYRGRRFHRLVVGGRNDEPDQPDVEGSGCAERARDP